MDALRLFVVGINWPAETFIQRKLNGLASSGIQVVVCSTNVRTHLHGRQGEIEVLELPDSSDKFRLIWWTISALLRNAIYHPKELLSVWRACSQAPIDTYSQFLKLLPFIGRRPDLIHFEWNFHATSYLPVWDQLNAPVVISCRGSQVQVAPHNPNRQHLVPQLRETFQRAGAVHCVSEAIKKEAVELGLDSNKAWVIRPAVDPEFFKPGTHIRNENGPFRIITTGSIIWLKGYEYALQAIRLLVEQDIDVRFEIIGVGNESQRLLYTIHDLELIHHVQWLGYQPPDTVRDRLQQADVFLLASLSEGISNALLEAMACGIPVVTTNCGGMREAVTDGQEVFVGPVREPGKMAKALQTLAQDPDLCRRMGQAGRERVCQQFTLDQQVEQFVKLYQSVFRAKPDLLNPD